MQRQNVSFWQQEPKQYYIQYTNSLDSASTFTCIPETANVQRMRARFSNVVVTDGRDEIRIEGMDGGKIEKGRQTDVLPQAPLGLSRCRSLSSKSLLSACCTGAARELCTGPFLFECCAQEILPWRHRGRLSYVDTARGREKGRQAGRQPEAGRQGGRERGQLEAVLKE